MTGPAYARFEVERPDHVGDAHWDAIQIEIDRFGRALDEQDEAQAIGYLKCLVEAVAKVVLDINGTPATANASFDATVKRSHDLLAIQPGYELALDTPFGNLATQARKMAVSMGTIRNNFGSGHGRARLPEVPKEMVDLALDGSLLWVRWALRRLGYFSQGRPETLIRDLVGDPDGSIVFYANDLTQRLHAANLPALEDKHTRAIGLAVGQRAARDTFNVRIEGIDRCIEDGDLTRWPAAYRLGAATGLLFSPAGHPTITAATLQRALRVCVPLVNASEDVVALVSMAKDLCPPQHLLGEWQEIAALHYFIEQCASRRPDAEQEAWLSLAARVESQ